MRLKWFVMLCSIIGFLGVVSNANAIDAEEQLQDKALEARARSISAGLRCLVCQNESIDDSDASLAKDLRLLVRQQLQQGKSDREAVDFIVARYGEFVLLRPRFSMKTGLLWATPVLLVLGGAVFALRSLKSREGGAQPPQPLSDAEQTALASMLGQSPPPQQNR